MPAPLTLTAPQYAPTVPTLTVEQRRKLASLRNLGTLYEIAATYDDGPTVLLCYGPTSRSAIARYVAKHGRRLADLLGCPDRGPGRELLLDSRPVGGGVTVAGAGKILRISASGRTQRQAIQEGELPWIFSKAG
jgi:hypothetical protein